MKKITLLLIGLATTTFLSDSLLASPVYMRSTTSQPWGLSGNETQMNNVFGAGNWLDLRYETASPASVFSAANSFVFMEGGDATANELQTFLGANNALISIWVGNGGRLLVNAAPNEGSGMSFGFGVTLTYPDYSATGAAVNPAHPIFNGPAVPVGLNFNGSSLSHAHVSGGGLSPIITDSNGDTILGELSFGSGNVVVGGLTLPFFTSNPSWTPQPSVANLHHNIIDYAANLTVVPEPATATVALLGLGVLVLNRRKARV
jgi:hypothetical protein